MWTISKTNYEQTPAQNKIICMYTRLFSFSFSSFFFLGPHLWHMKVSRLGVKLEMQLLAYATATAMPYPSCICNLHHSSWQTRSLTHWARPRIKHASSWMLVRFPNHWTMTGTRCIGILKRLSSAAISLCLLSALPPVEKKKIWCFFHGYICYLLFSLGVAV